MEDSTYKNENIDKKILNIYVKEPIFKDKH